jgi:hypothetical protein
MKITKDEFERYLKVQKSGVTNMFDVRTVEMFSGLDREKIMAIMKQYSELEGEYEIHV